jgi:putative ABC transport system ATP-binding protein
MTPGEPAIVAGAEVQAPAIVETQQLSKVYDQGAAAVTALEAVSLTVAPGEFLAVMGPSGCGKSTLLHLIGGLDQPTSGRMLLDGQDLAAMSDDDLTRLRRRRIGFVFQFYNLLPLLGVAENAALPLLLDGAGQAEARTRAESWLRRVGLGDRLDHRPDQLSGGQQQRVAIARALVTEPALILADEPTGNLDSQAGDEIAGLLRQISEAWGRTVLVVTHDPRMAAHAGRVISLQDGRIVDENALVGEAEQELLRSRLQQASAEASARAAHLSEKEVDELIEQARGEAHRESSVT